MAFLILKAVCRPEIMTTTSYTGYTVRLHEKNGIVLIQVANYLF